MWADRNQCKHSIQVGDSLSCSNTLDVLVLVVRMTWTKIIITTVINKVKAFFFLVVLCDNLGSGLTFYKETELNCDVSGSEKSNLAHLPSVSERRHQSKNRK